MTRTVLVVGGPTASGKTSVAGAVARRLGWDFVDADDLHPAENVDRMSAGRPLTEEHRRPWLDAVVDAATAGDRSMTIACSALRVAHRDRLRRVTGLRIVMLRPDLRTATERAAARTDHFMPAALVASQFEIVEWPQPDEPATRTLESNDTTVDDLVEVVIGWVHEG